MQVVILGSGSPIPSPDRAGPSTLVRTSAGDLLFDAGRGVSMRAAAALSGPGAFQAVFLTHLHSDHVTDLNDVITTRWAMSFIPDPLTVFGPVGTAALVAATEAMLETDIGYRLAHHEDLDLATGHRRHRRHRGRRLRAGRRAGDGGADRPRAGPSRPSATASTTAAARWSSPGTPSRATGSTGCAPVPTCWSTPWCAATRSRRSACPRLLDVLDYHSSVPDAAGTAERAGVGTLVLTHMVPAVQPGCRAGVDRPGRGRVRRRRWSWPRT